MKNLDPQTVVPQIVDPQIVEQVLNQFDLFVFTVTIAFTVVNITIYIIRNIHYNQIESTRVNEGLPTDVTLTSEDFRDNPELAEIFDVSDTENALDVNLESQEQLEILENQFADMSFNDLMDILDAIDIISFIIDFFS